MMAIFLLPAWLTGESNLTLATWGLVSATLVLGVATFLLYLDGRSKSREQRHRWEREDALTESAASPKVVFEFSEIHARKLELWCANLGTSNFLVSSVQIKSGPPTHQMSISLKPLIVPVGEIATAEILPTQLNFGSSGNYGRNCEVSLEGRGTSGQFITASQPYRMSVYSFDGGRVRLDHGFLQPEPIFCSNCNSYVADFNADGLTSLRELQNEISEIQREYAGTCPQHISQSVRTRPPEFGRSPETQTQIEESMICRSSVSRQNEAFPVPPASSSGRSL